MVGCTRHGLNREPPPPPPPPPLDPSILYRRSSTRLAPRYRATISPSGRRFQKRKLDCFRMKRKRKKEKRGKELYPLWRRREIVGALRPLPVPPHPVPPPPLPAFLAHTGPFPPSPSLFVFAYFAALCHTVHPRAHLSRDLANHRASIEPALSTTHLCRPCEIIGEKNKTASQLSQSTGRGCRLMVVVSPFFFFSSPLPPSWFFSPVTNGRSRCECRLIDQTSLPPRSDSQSCHSRFHRRGSHGTVTRNIRLYPREIFVLAAAPTDAGLLQSVELLGELIFERRQRHSGIWWHRPPPPPPPTPPTDAQSRHQGRPLPICLVSHPLRLPASCFHDLALPLSSAALSSFSSFPVLFSSTPLVSSIFICIACYRCYNA